MTNRHRGEVSLTLGAERFALRLSLQALAEIEAALGAGDLQGLSERFASGRIAARDLVALLGRRSAAGVRSSQMTRSPAGLVRRICLCRGGIVRSFRPVVRRRSEAAPSSP